MIPVNPAIVGIEAVNPTEPLIPVKFYRTILQKNHRFNSQKPPRDFSYLLAASLHYIIKLLYNTHAFIDPVLNHRNTYFEIVGYFFSFHSIRSHGQSSFFCLWHHDFIKIESQIADIFQLDDDNTPV